MPQRSEERRVGKSVDHGGRRIIKKKRSEERRGKRVDLGGRRIIRKENDNGQTSTREN